MEIESKYYFISSKNTSRNFSYIVKWNRRFYVEIDENVDLLQRIELTIDKFPDSVIEKPKSSKYEKVKPILKESFLDYYKLVIKLITKQLNSDGEFYLLKNGKDWFQVESYMIGKWNISIDFRDSIASLWLQVNSSSNFSGRPNSRKHGIPITKEKFEIFLRLTLKFLYDPDSYPILLDSFVANFYFLANEDAETENLMFSTDQALKDILAQLELRKRNIEKRLIETDNDNESDRIKLRGEIDGINYAISTMKISQ